MVALRCEWPGCKVRNPPDTDKILFENTRALLDHVPLPELLEVLKSEKLGLHIGFCQKHWDEFDTILGLKGAHKAHTLNETE